MHGHKSFIQHFQNGKHCLCCRVQATVLSGQHAALKHSLSCAWHLLSVLSRALCAKEKKNLSTATASNLFPPHWSVDYVT